MPPFAVALQEDGVGKAVAGHMLGRDGVPPEVLDGDAGLIAERLEAHFDVRDLFGGEAFLPPGEGKFRPRFPRCNSADLEDFTTRCSFDEASADARFEGKNTW